MNKYQSEIVAEVTAAFSAFSAAEDRVTAAQAVCKDALGQWVPESLSCDAALASARRELAAAESALTAADWRVNVELGDALHNWILASN